MGVYNSRQWLGRQGIGLNRYLIDGVNRELVNNPIQITQEGDQLSADNLNDLETRISSAFNIIDPTEYTYIIDTQEKFDTFLSFGGNNDYTNVLIKKKDTPYNLTRVFQYDQSSLTTPVTIRRITGYNNPEIIVDSVLAPSYGYFYLDNIPANIEISNIKFLTVRSTSSITLKDLFYLRVSSYTTPVIVSIHDNYIEKSEGDRILFNIVSRHYEIATGYRIIPYCYNNSYQPSSIASSAYDDCYDCKELKYDILYNNGYSTTATSNTTISLSDSLLKYKKVIFLVNTTFRATSIHNYEYDIRELCYVRDQINTGTEEATFRIADDGQSNGYTVDIQLYSITSFKILHCDRMHIGYIIGVVD